MKDFSEKTLQNLETLARIKCTEEETHALFDAISKVLDYMDQLDEVDTKDVPACNFVHKDLHYNIMREDDIEETLSTDLFLSNAPDQVGGMIKVPQILKNN